MRTPSHIIMFVPSAAGLVADRTRRVIPLALKCLASPLVEVDALLLAHTRILDGLHDLLKVGLLVLTFATTLALLLLSWATWRGRGL